MFYANQHGDVFQAPANAIPWVDLPQNQQGADLLAIAIGGKNQGTDGEAWSPEDIAAAKRTVGSVTQITPDMIEHFKQYLLWAKHPLYSSPATQPVNPPMPAAASTSVNPPMPAASATPATPPMPDLAGYRQQKLAMLRDLHAQYPNFTLEQLDAVASERLPDPTSTQQVKVSVQGQPMIVTLQQYLASKGEGFDKYDPARVVPWPAGSNPDGTPHYAMLTAAEAKDVSDALGKTPVTVTIGKTAYQVPGDKAAEFGIKMLEIEQKGKELTDKESENALKAILTNSEIDKNQAETAAIPLRMGIDQSRLGIERGRLSVEQGRLALDKLKAQAGDTTSTHYDWETLPNGSIKTYTNGKVTVDLQETYNLLANRAIDQSTGKPATAAAVQDFMANAWHRNGGGKQGDYYVAAAVKNETMQRFKLPKVKDHPSTLSLPPNFHYGGK